MVKKLFSKAERKKIISDNIKDARKVIKQAMFNIQTEKIIIRDAKRLIKRMQK